MNVIGEAQTEVRIGAEPRIKIGRCSRNIDLLVTTAPGRLGSSERVVADFLIPREETKAFAQGSAPPRCPPVVIGPIIGADGYMKNHVINEVLHVEQLGISRIGRAVGKVAFDPLGGGCAGQTGVRLSHHGVPSVGGAAVEFGEVFEGIVFVPGASEVSGLERRARVLGQVVDAPVETVQEEVDEPAAAPCLAHGSERIPNPLIPEVTRLPAGPADVAFLIRSPFHTGPGIRRKSLEHEFVKLRRTGTGEERIFQVTRAIGSAKDEAERMLGREVILPADVSVDVNSAVHLKAGLAVGVDQFRRGGSFPGVAAGEGVGINSGRAVPKIARVCHDAEGWKGCQRFAEAVAGLCLVHDVGIHLEVGAISIRPSTGQSGGAGRLPGDGGWEDIGTGDRRRRLEAGPKRGSSNNRGGADGERGGGPREGGRWGNHRPVGERGR